MDRAMTDVKRVQEIRKDLEDTLLSCTVPDLPNEGDVVFWLERRTAALEGILELVNALDARERRIEELEQAHSLFVDGAIEMEDALRALLGRVVEALDMQMKWIGPPPIGPQYFDSLREDAWKKGQAALADARALGERR